MIGALLVALLCLSWVVIERQMAKWAEERHRAEAAVLRTELKGLRLEVATIRAKLAARRRPPAAAASQPVATKPAAVTAKVEVVQRPKRRRALGVLRVNSTPGSKVLINGKAVGNTPLRLRVAPGRHVLTFIDAKQRRSSQQVVVRAGRTTNVVASLIHDYQS